MIRLEIGGAGFLLDPAAISCVRYRARYGESVVTEMERGKPIDGPLLRMCWMMVHPHHRPELPEFALLARKTPTFRAQALAARAALLAPDPRGRRGGQDTGERFDEYKILASMYALDMDSGLLYELPILHLASLVGRVAELKYPDPDAKRYRPMTAEEMGELYPRPIRKG